MAPRGLKVGETFVDGGRSFVVDKVLPDGNYISHQVKNPVKRATGRKAVK